MHGHSIMVDYKGRPDRRRWGEKIDAKNFKSNRAWSREMDVNNAYRLDLNEFDTRTVLLCHGGKWVCGERERERGEFGGFSNYLLHGFGIIALPLFYSTACNLVNCPPPFFARSPPSSSPLPLVINTV